MRGHERELFPLIWDENSPPRSSLYDDVYFSKADGLAEARAVFLAGCGLPDGWSGRTRFSIAELGFGTGLNVVALLDLWRRSRPSGGRLSVFSVEAHPMSAGDAARALAPWPEIGDLAGMLTARWPGSARGFHRIDLPELHATIDLAVMEAAEGVAQWDGRADAWFLDGFSPARNPAMWRAELLRLVAARSAPGARLASFTVAGQVRRDLAAAGFVVERRPGFGAKRERLEARLNGTPPSPRPRPQIAIIGAGIAGAALARAFRAQGATARVFDAAGPGAGASGGPAALAAPRLDAGLAAPAALFAQAFARAADLYEATGGAVIARRAIQLAVSPKDAARFETIAASDLFEPGALKRLGAGEIAARLGEAAPAGLLIDRAVVVEPAPLLAAWLGSVRRARVAAVASAEPGWRLLGARGGTIATADVVCLAAGVESARLAAGLGLLAVRGQASHAGGAAWPVATVFGGYVIPTRDGVLFGATHDRGDESDLPREADHARNLEAVAAVLPKLAARLEGKGLEAHAAVRAATSDYFPLAGAVSGASPGLFVLSGLGSRGFTLAPLLGEHVAALALGAPSPLPSALAALVDPARFARRAHRRGRAAG